MTQAQPGTHNTATSSSSVDPTTPTTPTATACQFVVLEITRKKSYYNNRAVDPTTNNTVDLSDLIESALSTANPQEEVAGTFLLRIELKVTVLSHAPLEQPAQIKDEAVVPTPVED